MASHWLKAVERWFKLAVLPPAVAAVIRALGRSMRIETRGHEHVDRLYREGKRVIIAFWHARQLMMPLTYRWTLTHILRELGSLRGPISLVAGSLSQWAALVGPVRGRCVRIGSQTC